MSKFNRVSISCLKTVSPVESRRGLRDAAGAELYGTVR
jgi:hypothetical protein